MSFGKSFETKKEADAHLKKLKAKGLTMTPTDLDVRRMNRISFPRRKKLWHVGSYLDFCNFA